MKNTRNLLAAALCAFAVSGFAQNVSTRTNEFEVDFSDPNKLVTSTIPVINWITPTAETTYAQENKYKIKFEIESGTPIKNITISIKEGVNAASRGSQTFQPELSRRFRFALSIIVLQWLPRHTVGAAQPNEGLIPWRHARSVCHN